MNKVLSIALACGLAITAASTFPRAANAQSGTMLNQRCGNAWTAGFVNRGYCHSYITGLVNELAASRSAICLPPVVTDTQLVMIVQAYMRDHPAQLNATANAIIARAVASVYPCRNFIDAEKLRTANVQLSNVTAAMELFRLDVGRYPSQAEGLDALVDDPMTAKGWHGPYLRRAGALYDPWGHKFRYRVPGAHGPFDLFSFGSIAAPTYADNPVIANWRS